MNFKFDKIIKDYDSEILVLLNTPEGIFVATKAGKIYLVFFFLLTKDILIKNKLVKYFNKQRYLRNMNV